jgi:anti-anti-sigma factor
MIEKEQLGKVTLVKLAIGSLDTNVAADIRESLSQIVQTTNDVILLDLGQVHFMDSSGLAAIVYCFKMTEMKDQLAICGVNERVLQLFQITKLHAIVRIFKTREEALEALDSA